MLCYDIVEMSIAGARESNPEAQVNEDVLCRVRKDCDALDGIAADNDCECLTANADDGTLTLSVACPGYEFRGGRSSPFFDVIEHCDSFSFCNDGDTVVLTLCYGGIFL